jgi:hypothetical protein
VRTNIANVNAFGAIDVGGGFEWKDASKEDARETRRCGSSMITSSAAATR